MKKYTDFSTGKHSFCIHLCVLFTKGLYLIMVKIFTEFVYDDLLYTRGTTEVENGALVQVENSIKQNIPWCPRLGHQV